MKHAGPSSLERLSQLLQQLRAVPGIKERRPGCFYRGSVAFLHFHEDGPDLFADAKLSGNDFERLPVTTQSQQRALLHAVQLTLTERKSKRPYRSPSA